MTVPEPGPLGEEAARLVEAARAWAARTFPDVDAHLSTGAAECRHGPLCRLVAVLRGDRPEVTDRLADAVTAAAGALAAVLEAVSRPAPTTPADAAQPAGPRPPAGVQPIPLDED